MSAARPVRFALDDGQTFDAVAVDDELWNGFPVALMTPAQLDALEAVIGETGAPIVRHGAVLLYLVNGLTWSVAQ